MKTFSFLSSRLSPKCNENEEICEGPLAAKDTHKFLFLLFNTLPTASDSTAYARSTGSRRRFSLATALFRFRLFITILFASKFFKLV